MPSPFPGMDPYIESQLRFHSFHSSFINACAEVINENLSSAYFATVEEWILVDATEPGEFVGRRTAHRLGPDVAVVIQDDSGNAGLSGFGGPAASLIPRTLPQAVVAIDQPTQKLVEIRGLPEDWLVTTVELLSPSNKKTGADRDSFLVKRADLLRQGVNLVDLDLLLAGQRIPLLVPFPPGDYHALVTRAQTHEQCDVYSWGIQNPLPTIPVPLAAGVPDVPLNLATAFERVYQRFHYDRMLRYGKPLTVPMSDADRQWAVGRATAAGPTGLS